MNYVKLLALLPALIIGTSALAADPCDGEPEVLCSRALKIGEMFAKRNIRNFGTGARRVFRGEMKFTDVNGTEHSGPVIAKTMWTNFPEIRIQGETDSELFAKASVYDREGKIQFSTVVGKFFGYGDALLGDPKVKATIDPLGGDRFSQTTFLNVEASDIQIAHLPGVGTQQEMRLNYVKLDAVPSASIKDLIEASIVPSYAMHQGSKLLDSWDLDLKEAQQNHALVMGSVGAVLVAKGKFSANRFDTPTGELPAHCKRKEFIQVGYEARIDIPYFDLKNAVVEHVKTEVLSCS